MPAASSFGRSPTTQFGAIIIGVTKLLDDRPDARLWRDVTVAL
jgi:hypothetical protein